MFKSFVERFDNQDPEFEINEELYYSKTQYTNRANKNT